VDLIDATKLWLLIVESAVTASLASRRWSPVCYQTPYDQVAAIMDPRSQTRQAAVDDGQAGVQPDSLVTHLAACITRWCSGSSPAGNRVVA
jgi:hypothetical protein